MHSPNIDRRLSLSICSLCIALQIGHVLMLTVDSAELCQCRMHHEQEAWQNKTRAEQGWIQFPFMAMAYGGLYFASL